MPGNSPLPRAWLWAPPLAYMALIFVLSSEPDPAPILTRNVWDKSLHLFAYAGLAVLLCRAFVGERVALAAALVCAFAATSLYGGTDEWHQSFTPGRSSDILDWLADTVGAVLGIGLYGLVRLHVGRVHLDADRLADQID